jgi:hypothetical protein
MGFNNHNLDLHVAPKGRGAADGFVLSEFQRLVKAQRKRSGKAKTGLLTMVDADIREVNAVAANFDGKLDSKRGPKEHIAVFIPKRNIGTWVRCLGERRAVDEATDYGRWSKDSDCHPAVDHFLELARTQASQVPDDCPPSVKRSLEEYPRIARLRE